MKLPRRKRAAGRASKLQRRREARDARIGLATVLKAMASPDFLAMFRVRAALDPPASLEAVRSIALGVLASMDVDTSDALLTFAWDPATKKLDAWCRPKLKLATTGLGSKSME